MAAVLEMVEDILEETVEASVAKAMEEGAENEVVQAVLVEVIDNENVNVEAETEVIAFVCLLKSEVLKQKDSYRELL